MNIKRLINYLTIAIIATILVGIMTTLPVYAETTKEAACAGIGLAGGDCDASTSDSKLTSIIATVINWFSWIVGAVSVIMIIYGGFRYVTSAGDSSKITAARQTIMYALVGLVVVALSQLLVKFVLNASSEAIAPTAQLNTQQILPSVNNYDINLVS